MTYGVLLEAALARALGDHGVWGSLMYGTLMKIVVKPGKRSKLLDYLRWDAQVAKASEPGTWRFDVWEVKKKKRGVYLRVLQRRSRFQRS